MKKTKNSERGRGAENDWRGLPHLALADGLKWWNFAMAAKTKKGDVFPGGLTIQAVPLKLNPIASKMQTSVPYYIFISVFGLEPL